MTEQRKCVFDAQTARRIAEMVRREMQAKVGPRHRRHIPVRV